MAYNTYATSPMRGYLNDSTGSVFTKLCTNEDMMKHMAKTVNRTWCYDKSTTVDSAQCTHTADKFWLLGNGNINCNGNYVSGSTTYTYLKDFAYDTSKFEKVFGDEVNCNVSSNTRIKNYNGSAYY